MSFFLTFRELLLLMNRRGRETTVWLFFFLLPGFEVRLPCFAKQLQNCQKVVEINTLTWAEWPRDVLPKGKWLILIHDLTQGTVVSNHKAAGNRQSSDVNVDFSALLCPDCSAGAELKLNRADRTRSSRVEQQHFWANCALLLKVLPEKKKNNLPLLNSHGGNGRAAHD